MASRWPTPARSAPASTRQCASGSTCCCGTTCVTCRPSPASSRRCGWSRWYIAWYAAWSGRPPACCAPRSSWSCSMPLQTAPSRSERPISNGGNGGNGAGTDLADRLRGKEVSVVGRLASMSNERFEELVTSYGAKYATGVARGILFVVIGEGEWPMGQQGRPLGLLRKLRVGKRLNGWSTTVLTERQ